MPAATAATALGSAAATGAGAAAAAARAGHQQPRGAARGKRAGREEADPDPQQQPEAHADVDVGGHAARPSARMTTTAQRPLRGSHSSVCVPAPLEDATQKRWDPGGCGVPAPGTRSYRAMRSPSR